MITIKPGSHVQTLLSILSFVGEFPMRSLHLLGSARSYKDLVYKLTRPQEFRFPDKGERFTCKLLTVSGRGKNKTIRLHRSALPLLKFWDEDAYDNYLYEFNDHAFSGNPRHVNRNHLMAETAAMCMRAGIEANPLYTPEIMDEDIRQLNPDEPCFFFGRDLKRLDDYELNKIRFTRLAGTIVYSGGLYYTYNYREEILKWMGDGEQKIKFYLQSVFYGLRDLDYRLDEAAVLFGANYDLALDILQEMAEKKFLEHGIFKTYSDVMFVPMDSFGIRLLRLITTPNWQEEILDALFYENERSYGKGIFAYDAIRNEKYYLSFLDSNILRLFRFHKAALEREGTFVVACHQEQLPFLQTYFGDSAKFAVVNTEKLESILNIEKRDLILEG